MIGLFELLLIVLIILLVFGTTRLSRAAETTKAAIRVGKKRFWVTNPVTGEKELTLMTAEKELALGQRSDAEVRQKWGLYEESRLRQSVQEIGLREAPATEQTKLSSHFIKEAAKLKGGSKEPGRVIVGSITTKQAEKIAQEKMKDLNAFDLKEATKIICGSARSMGIEVKAVSYTHLTLPTNREV